MVVGATLLETESPGQKVHAVYNFIQIASDPSEEWYHFVPIPAVKGDACFLYLQNQKSDEG